MIKYIPYHQIDKTKYDYCIRHSKQSRIYAYSWYLDCTVKRWDLLVEDDYKIVMPLPRKSKWGIQYIFTPPWIQQLGLFSIEDLSKEKVKYFLRHMSRKYFWIDYQFNALNDLDTNSTAIRKNYTLSLNNSFKEIQQGYNKNRKRVSRNINSELLIDKEGNIDHFMESYKNQSKPYEISDQAIEVLRSLAHLNNDHIHVWNVFEGKSLVAGLLWLKDERRITYLVPMTLDKGKELHAATFLINELIRDFQETNMLLDFEGSMVEGVEKFYQSFGAVPEYYSYYKKRFLSHV